MTLTAPGVLKELHDAALNYMDQMHRPPGECLLCYKEDQAGSAKPWVNALPIRRDLGRNLTPDQFNKMLRCFCQMIGPDVIAWTTTLPTKPAGCQAVVMTQVQHKAEPHRIELDLIQVWPPHTKPEDKPDAYELPIELVNWFDWSDLTEAQMRWAREAFHLQERETRH